MTRASDRPELQGREPEGLYNAFGDRACQLAADEPLEVSAARVAKLIPDALAVHAETVRKALVNVRAGLGAQRFSCVVPRETRAQYFEVRLAKTSPQIIAVVVRDISEWTSEHSKRLESESRFRIMANHAPVLLWMAGVNGECDFFNQRWLAFTGRSLAQELGVGWAGGVHFEDFQRCMTVYFESFVERQPFSMEYRLRRADGVFCWILDQGVPRFAPDGTFEGYIGSCIDVTALKEAQSAMSRFNAELEDNVRLRTAELDAALKEKEVLLREIHHRVKNNLQVISSLLRLQARQLTESGAADASEVEQAFMDCQGRVRSMALVHEKLYQTTDLSQVDFGSYLGALVKMIMSADSAPHVRVELEIETVRLGVDQAIPCGLVVHELISNALKHAFPEQRRGKVRVELKRLLPGRLSLGVVDDGVGLASDIALEHPPSLGLALVTTLARQLRAEICVDRTHGTAFRLLFPEGA